MRTLALSVVVLVTACCTQREATATDQKVTADGTVKPGAPSELTSKVGNGQADLSIRFAAEGLVSSVTVNGIDGVTVTSSPELLSNTRVSNGETRGFDVRFTGQGHLVVTVNGTFGGAQKSRVHSVKVGDAVQQTGTVQVTDDGDVVKVQ